MTSNQTVEREPGDVAAVERCREAYHRIRDELCKVIVGQGEVIEQVLITMLSGGHALLEGVPGLAKTLLVSSLAESLHLSFRRIQFTPDLMPSDVTGTEVIQEDSATRERRYRFLPGPIFANLLLADEINRTPPKTQAAMLEAMQERQISAGGERHQLPAPFFVLATQNPLDQEGTYPLPEAQLDRFLMHIKVGYPSGSDEWEIARRVTSGRLGSIEPCMSGSEILQLQELVKRVPVSDQVLGYAWTLVRASRPGTDEAPEFVNQWVSWGAGPRGLITLIMCAKSRAVLHGRHHATASDVEAVAKPALRHRIAGNYAALAKHLTGEKLIEMLLEAVPADRRYEAPMTDLQ
ncbi:MAG: MoxR family ATPase [Planctomycetaceae bacterium]|nr:MoxR family ATPase [Planctomycetales bacterium]MCB9923527.1 MoxR family ATPase [Planctomycetaceae bacterium]